MEVIAFIANSTKILIVVPKSQHLQADYTNIKHWCEEMEKALKEMKGTHARRIFRNIK
jgi:hypothetical protein